MLCWLTLIFSPFLGFAIHGKVAAPGLAIGLKLAVIPLLGLVALASRRWYVWRRLPAGLTEEWRSGRVVPPAGAPTIAAPIRFSHEKDWVDMRPEGVVLSRHALLRMSGIPHPIEKNWVVEQAGQMFVPWGEIREWTVEEDSDGPDFYGLTLLDGGRILVRRFLSSGEDERDLLDAVRSIGHLPVRLHCDVEDA